MALNKVLEGHDSRTRVVCDFDFTENACIPSAYLYFRLPLFGMERINADSLIADVAEAMRQRGAALVALAHEVEGRSAVTTYKAPASISS
jgi:hypothetical protein